jgi:hypothetical protein
MSFKEYPSKCCRADTHMFRQRESHTERCIRNSCIVVCIRYRGNVFTKPLPSNDKDSHTQTQNNGRDLRVRR